MIALICVNFVLSLGFAFIGGSLAFFTAFRYNQYIYSQIKQH
jgi:hypothetical protein